MLPEQDPPKAPEVDPLEESLRTECHEVDFEALTPHAARQAILLVMPSLKLIDCALAVAKNRVPIVDYWLAQGLLRKPTFAELQAWHSAPSLTRFRFVIVQPFVLAERLAD